MSRNLEGYYPGAILSDYYITVERTETRSMMIKVNAASVGEAKATAENEALSEDWDEQPVWKRKYESVAGSVEGSNAAVEYEEKAAQG